MHVQNLFEREIVSQLARNQDMTIKFFAISKHILGKQLPPIPLDQLIEPGTDAAVVQV